MYTRRGFTLIEVLVSITILGILSSIIYVSFGEARQNSRNQALVVEVKELQLALETYRSQNEKYPSPSNGCGTGPTDEIVARTDAAVFGCDISYINSNTFVEAPTLVTEYIPKLPLADDSANPDCVFEYRTDTAGTWYKLTAISCLAGVADGSGQSLDGSLERCPAFCPNGSSGDPCFDGDPTYNETFAVYSLGGECK